MTDASGEGSYSWQLPGLFQHDQPSRFGLLILNHQLDQTHVLRRLWENASIRVAADGGANHLYELARRERTTSFDNLDVIYGDLDSLRDDARAYFQATRPPTEVIYELDQYAPDFTKAVKYMRKSRPDGVDIIAVGGLGGRVDQAISQLHQLFLFQQGGQYLLGRLYLVSSDNLTFLLSAGKHRIRVRDGGPELFDKYVGILPLKEPSRITLRGFEWDVEDWATCMGGLLSTSNHVLPNIEWLEIETTKDVIFTIALKRPEGGEMRLHDAAWDRGR